MLNMCNSIRSLLAFPRRYQIDQESVPCEGEEAADADAEG